MEISREKKGEQNWESSSRKNFTAFLVSVGLAVGYLVNLMPKSLGLGLKATNMHL